MEFGFERLQVWHKATNFASSIYTITETFPQHELYGLRSQLRRASVSISSNIAEGWSRSSKRDFARFVEIAYGSVMEVVSQLRIAAIQGYISEANENKLRNSADELARMLSGLKANIKKP